ncbi:T9SS type A sorting domain-containing protein, partial [Candidatus Neomarinimicrobiota bacterium]
GDVTAFSVWNDLAEHAWVGTNKLNAEVRQTIFAFNRADALGDMIFIKWQIINKSASDWDSSYFSIWVDPDLGDAGDDLVGSDSTLGLGFVYNATNSDQRYGTAPPASGVDFFQGPIVDEVGSTVTLPDGTVLTDKKMLGMTSFVYYDNDDSPKGNPDTGGDVWNYFRGYWKDDVKITEGDRGRTEGNPGTNFMFSGDPEAGTGWLDSEEADRRFLMTTGPFDMPVWDDENANGQADFGETGVQEIVAVVIVARGADNLNSVTVLKQVDELAQLAYDLNFNLASAPASPSVSVSELPNEVVLTWTEKSEFLEDGITAYTSTDPIVAQAYGDTVTMDNVEKVIEDSTYNFYGYTVYQYSDASGADPVVLEHWDTGGEIDAVPYTAQRFLRVLLNKHSAVGDVGSPLINGKPYFFGIVAEGYLEYGAPKVLLSASTIVTAIPQFMPGVRYQTTYNDTVVAVHAQVDDSQPPSQGEVTVWVVDPSETTGDAYKVIFSETDPVTWDLINVTTSDTLLKDQENQRADDAYNIIDGLMIKVGGATPGILAVTQVDSADWTVEIDNNLNFSLSSSDRRAAGDVSFYMEAQDGEDPAVNLTRWDWRGNMTPNDYFIEFPENPEVNGSIGLNFYGDDPAVQAANGGSALINGWVAKDSIDAPDSTIYSPGRLPFKVWKQTPAGALTQVLGCILDDDEDNHWSLAQPGYFVGDNTAFERIYVVDHPYDEAELLADNGVTVVTDVVWDALWDSGHTLGRVLFSMYYNNIDAISGSPPSPGTVVKFATAKPNSSNDYFTFTAPPAKSEADSNLVVDIDKINVVPNPYYGYHSGESDIFSRWVQFTYLPPIATVSIYDLAGQLVRKLEKDDASTLLQWDLSNAYGLPVASGVYIYVVDTDYGQKIGKMAVFTPNERVDIW